VPSRWLKYDNVLGNIKRVSYWLLHYLGLQLWIPQSFILKEGKNPEEVTEEQFMNIKDNRFTRYNRIFFMTWKHLTDDACLFFRQSGVNCYDSEDRGSRLLRNDSNHHASYGYNKPDNCRPNFYRQKSCLQRTGLQCATMQTPSLATFPLQINVTGEVFLNLICKIVRSRYVYCAFQCQPNKSNISRRTRYTNFSLCHFNADNILKKSVKLIP